MWMDARTCLGIWEEDVLMTTSSKPRIYLRCDRISGGHECRYCPFAKTCGIARHAMPKASSAAVDPQFVAEAADLAREAKRSQSAVADAETQLRNVQHEIRERLRAKGLRRVAGDDFSIVWSPVKGRQSFDVKALKAAAIAAGVDVNQFETTGEATDRLDVRVHSTLSKSE
jgi:hypothetical protein